MYFLRAAISGMKRRIVTSILTIFGGAALLTAAAAIGLWSMWLTGQQDHLKAARSASVFIDTSEPSVVEDVLTRVMEIHGVETARIVSVAEFQGFLKDHFPDLHEALDGMGEEVVPRMLEVVFPANMTAARRHDTVESIGQISSVARVDDGASRLGKAMTSLRWLGIGGTALAIGLWVVLFIVCLGYYQGVLYTDAQEIQLIRSFGATKSAILFPWLIEAVIQSLLTGLFCGIVLFSGRAYLAEVYNQFFGTLGYEAFSLDFGNFALAAISMIAMAMVAHVLAGVAALFRGRIA
jgi:cell division protein FtsX